MVRGNWTYIRISKELAERLKNLGKKGETYEEIIWRLVEAAGSRKRSRRG